MPLRIDTKTLRSQQKVIVASYNECRLLEWTLTLTYEELRDAFGDLSGLDIPAEHDWREEGF